MMPFDTTVRVPFPTTRWSLESRNMPPTKALSAALRQFILALLGSAIARDELNVESVKSMPATKAPCVASAASAGSVPVLFARKHHPGVV